MITVADNFKKNKRVGSVKFEKKFYKIEFKRCCLFQNSRKAFTFVYV
jgi:hypothetical protein